MEIEERIARIRDLFDSLEMFAEAVTASDFAGLVVPGTPGTGKSFTVERVLRQYDPNGVVSKTIKGHVTPQRLYTSLYNLRVPGQVLVLDDTDSVFEDAISLNMLKAACESRRVRRISWESSKPIFDDEGLEVPGRFEYEGGIIFLSNMNFERQIQKQTKMSVHLEALQSRCNTLPIIMNGIEDYMARMMQLYQDQQLLQDIEEEDAETIINFLMDNLHCLRDHSLRVVGKVKDIHAMLKRRNRLHDFERMARVMV